MKKIWKSLKWYFSHIKWGVVIFLWVVLNLATLGSTFPDWKMNVGVIVIALIVPILGITHAKQDREMKIRRDKIEKELEIQRKLKLKDDTIEYLSTMCYQDRLDLLKEVQEKTKGKS